MVRSKYRDHVVSTPTPPETKQGTLGDFVDSVQRGFFQATAGMFETADQVTGLGGGLRDWSNVMADAQIEQMSQEGQDSLTQEIFTEDEQGRLTLGEGATNARTWLNLLGQGAGTVAGTLTGGGVVGGGLKLGARAALTATGRKALEKEALQQAGKAGFKGKAKSIVANSALSIAVGNGMVANGEREKYAGMSLDELSNSPAFSDEYWTLRDDPANANVSSEELGEIARSAMADKAADRAFQDPKLTAANAIGGLAGVLGGRSFGLVDDMFKPAATVKGGVGKGFLIEGAQETGQGGMEALVSNEIYRDLVDPDFDVTQGVAASALNEGVIGGALGATSGGIGGAMSRRKAQDVDESAELADQDLTQEAESAPEPTPVTGNPTLDGELGSLDTSLAATEQALEGAKQRRTDNERDAANRARRSALVENGILPERNQQQTTLDLARSYDSERYEQIANELSNPLIDENPEYAQELESELLQMAQQASSLGVDPLATAVDQRTQGNRRTLTPEQKLGQRLNRYEEAGVIPDAVLAHDQVRHSEDYQTDQQRRDLINQKASKARDSRLSLNTGPFGNRQLPDGWGQREDTQTEIENDAWATAEQERFNQAQREEGFDKALAQQEQLESLDARRNQLAGGQSRLSGLVDAETEMTSASRAEEQRHGAKQRELERTFNPIKLGSSGVSKRLRRKMRKAKGFDGDAVLDELQHAEKRLKAYILSGEQVDSAAADLQEHFNGEAQPVDAATEQAAIERMSTPEAEAFKENLITQTMNNLNDVVDSSQGTVLEMDGKETSLPEVKRQLSNSVRALANKYIGKTAAMNENLRQQREANQPVQPKESQVSPVANLTDEQIANEVDSLVQKDEQAFIDSGLDSRFRQNMQYLSDEETSRLHDLKQEAMKRDTNTPEAARQRNLERVDARNKAKQSNNPELPSSSESLGTEGVLKFEHTTKRGKKLEGYIVPSSRMSKEQAQAIDKYTFPKAGGWFVRSKHKAELESALSGSTEQQAETVAPIEPEVIDEQEREDIKALGSTTVDQAHEDAQGEHKKTQTRLRKIKNSITAAAIDKDWTDKGIATLVGKPLNSVHDFAVLSQVYRNPSYETFRYVIVKDNQVVAQLGLSSRTPGSTAIIPSGKEASAFLNDIKNIMKDTGADGFYIMHNHPSGFTTPSSADIGATRTLINNLDGFKGHVVINEANYAIIDKSLNVTTGTLSKAEQNPAYNLESWKGDAEKESLFSTLIDSPDAVVGLAKQFEKDNHMVVIGRKGSSGKVSFVSHVDLNDPIFDSASTTTLTAMLRSLMRSTGSVQFVVTGLDSSIPWQNNLGRELLGSGMALDVLDTNLNSMGIATGQTKEIKSKVRLVENEVASGNSSGVKMGKENRLISDFSKASAEYEANQSYRFKVDTLEKARNAISKAMEEAGATTHDLYSFGQLADSQYKADRDRAIDLANEYLQQESATKAEVEPKAEAQTKPKPKAEQDYLQSSDPDVQALGRFSQSEADSIISHIEQMAEKMRAIAFNWKKGDPLVGQSPKALYNESNSRQFELMISKAETPSEFQKYVNVVTAQGGSTGTLFDIMAKLNRRHMKKLFGVKTNADIKEHVDNLAEMLEDLALKLSAPQPKANQATSKQRSSNDQANKIDDFGETLHGARKHNWGAFGDAVSKDMTRDEMAGEPLSKLFPKPNYQKLKEAGVSNINLAMIAVMRGTIPTKPRARYRRASLAKWVDTVEAARKLTQLAMNNDPRLTDAPFHKNTMGQVLNLIADKLTVEQIETLGNFEAGYYNISKKFAFKRKKAYGRDSVEANSIEELGEKVVKLFEGIESSKEGASTTTKSRADLGVYTRRFTGEALIGLKVGSRVIDIKTGFESTKEARAYLTDNRTALEDEVIAKRKEMRKQVRSDSNRDREGMVERKGNVTPEDFSKAFGFRGVQFGNWVEGKRRQQDLNNAYDSLMDLAKLMGVSPRAIALNGKLGLAFGARGKGGQNAAAAHFEPGTFVINLTKKSGQGSLAHEWFHALDYHFGKGTAVSRRNTAKGVDGIRPEMAEHWDNIKKAIANTNLEKRSKERDEFRSKPYWSTQVEMFARSFESWVIEQNSHNGVTNDYLANVLPDDSSSDYPYPTQAEMDNGLSQAYSQFAGALQEQSDGDNINLYSLDADKVVSSNESATKQDVEGFVSDVFEGSPDIAFAQTQVKVVQSETDLPSRMVEQIERDGAEGSVKGLYDPETDQVYIVADKVQTKELAERVIFHELVGHHGLRRLFGDSLNTELVSIRSMLGGKSGVLKLARKMGVDLGAYVDVTDRAVSNGEISASDADTILLEELIAHVAEKKAVSGPIDRLLNKVKNWLRRHGFGELVGYGKSDLLELMTNIRTSFDAPPPNGGGAKQRGSQSDKVRGFYSQSGDYKVNLHKAMSSLKSHVRPIKVMDVPDVLKALGMPDFPIVITRDVARKVTNGVKDEDHAVSMEIIERLPDLLSDPVAVFTPKDKNKAQEGGKNVVIQATLSNGKPVLVALHANVKNFRFDIERMDVNKVASAYGKGAQSLNGWVEGGLLEYVKSKNPEWLRLQGLQLPKERTASRGFKESVLTKADIVKKGRGLYSLDGKRRATDFAKKAAGDSAPTAQVNGSLPDIDSVLATKQSNLVTRIKAAIKGFSPIEAIGRNKYAMLTLGQMGEVASLINKDLGLMIYGYQKEVDAMVATQNTLAEEAANVSEGLTKWAKKNAKAADQMFKFAHEATLADVDPSVEFIDRADDIKLEIARLERAYKEYGGSGSERGIEIAKELKEMRDMLKQEPFRRREHERLRPVWERMSKDQKAKFREMRDYYIKQGERFDKALEENINRAVEDQKIRKEMIAKLRQRQELRAKGLYFPLSRFGDYWVDFADKDGQRQFMMFESKAEMEATRDKLRDAGFDVSSGMKAKASDAQSVPLPFVADVMNLVRGSKMNKHNADMLSDQIYQMYLRTLPGRSLRRNFIHRKGVEGFSQDAIRVLADNGFKQSRQQARLDHMDVLDNHLVAIQKHAETSEDNAEISRITEELGKRHEWVRNPSRSAWAQKLTSLGFVWLLGATPAAALVNLTQNLQVALPILSSRYGMAESSGEMAKASKEFMGAAMAAFKDKGRERGHGILGNQLKGLEKEAFRKAVLQGAIDTTQAADLAGLAENPNAKYSGKWNKAMNMVGWAFHNAEVFNREVTFITAYRLAMKKTGDHEASIEAAIKDTQDSHFDYSSTNRARFMQSDGAAVALQFKQYSQNMTFYLSMNLFNSLKGESPEVKAAARKQLLGTLAVTFGIGGLGALPLWALTGVLNAANDVVGDDDEPWDAETELKAMLGEAFGKEAAAMLW